LSQHFDTVVTADWPPLACYGLALLSVGAAYFANLLWPALHSNTPFLCYIVAVGLSSLYAGLRPGLLAAGLSLLLAPGWTPNPNGGLLPPVNPYPLHSLAFAVIAGIILLSTFALRRTRRRTLDDRQAYEERLRYQAFLLDNVSDAICMIDRSMCITYWNRGAAQLYGWSAAEVMGRDMADVVRTTATPDVRRTRVAAVDRGEQQRFEVVHHTRSGSPIHVDASVSALLDGAGKITGYVIIARDITARKQFEQELMALHATLEQRVTARTAELERSNRELDQFAYVASHDLKAPLRSIALLTDWISEDAAPVLTGRSLDHLQKLKGRVKRMERLLDDLLAYSRAGRAEQPPQLVDTLLLVQETVELLNLPGGFQVVLPETMPKLYTERVPLATVFRNLIQNACKHHTDPDRGCVTIMAEDLGGAVRFAVADDGPGIPAEHRAAVFELFRTLKPRDQVEGSGMGLSVVKKTVESRGGTIELVSSPGQGATFTFTWPKAARPD
jgi:PAS domain S-box-containing protein